MYETDLTQRNVSRDIENECQLCGQHVIFPEEGSGQKVDCPGCGKPIVLGLSPIGISTDAPALASTYQAACKHCGKRIVFPSGCRQEVVDCPHCEVPLFLGDLQCTPIVISQDQRDSLMAATKMRVDERKNKNQQLIEKYGTGSHPIFGGISLLFQLLIFIAIILIIVAIGKFVTFWALQ